MFKFIKFDSPSNSKAYDKGILFEKLCTTLLDASGFNNIKLRVKNNNLEYDIEAENKITKQLLVGEAKAHEKKMSSEIMEFIGKMNIYWIENKDVWGIFISLSELTPDVKGQVDKLINAGYHITYKVGIEILDALVEQSNYHSISQIKAKTSDMFNCRCGDTYFLVSDRGYYYIQLVIRNNSTLPTEFVSYDSNGNLISDVNFLSKLKEEIDDIKEFDFITNNEIAEYRKLHNSEKEQNNSFLGVMSGTGWFDYQFPADPNKFVGRDKVIINFKSFIQDVLTESTATRVCEILSRSGVGKSSITLKLEKISKDIGYPCTVIDSRNLRSESDILQVFQQVIKSHNEILSLDLQIPIDRKGMLESVLLVDKNLSKNNKIAIIFLDQFESIFSRPRMYNHIMDLILEISINCKSFVFCIARKNDQPTTYDESAMINLNRLKSISRTFVLDDFQIEEAIELISHISDEINQPLIKTLKEQILEISNGFPWLLKKYCAHIITLVKKGITQREIVKSGMQLDDLFYEDIAALDEEIREFFNRLVYFLPATYNELSEVFVNDELVHHLSILQNNHRIIRLTGRTYDTYNDVLKEYVKTGHVNVSRRYLLRYNPRILLSLYSKIADEGWSNSNQIANASREGLGSIENKLTELRKLKLIEGSSTQIVLNSSALKAKEEDYLLRHVNSTLMNNSIFKMLYDKLQKTSPITLNEVKELIKNEMPFIDTAEGLWDNYAKVLCNWMNTCKIALFKDNKLFKIESPESINMLITDEFLPSTQISQMIRILMVLHSKKSEMTISELKKSLNRTSLNGHLADAYFLGFITGISRSSYIIDKSGIEFLESNESRKKQIIELKLMQLKHIENYVSSIQNGCDARVSFENLIIELGIVKWNETTIKWKHKILRNWLSYCDLIGRKRKFANK